MRINKSERNKLSHVAVTDKSLHSYSVLMQLQTLYKIREITMMFVHYSYQCPGQGGWSSLDVNVETTITLFS